MLSQTQIANGALIALGVPRIASISDSSKAAQLLNDRWDPVRLSLLRNFPWSFAKTRATLATLVTTPAFTYSNQFQLPADCLRLIEVVDVDDYVVEDGMILCNESSLDVRYIKNVTDTSKFDPLFCEALSMALALSVCTALTNSNSQLEIMQSRFDRAIGKARSIGSVEDPASMVDADDLTAGRFRLPGLL